MMLRQGATQAHHDASGGARGAAVPRALPTHLLTLQRLAGNRAVAAAVRPEPVVAQRACCAGCAGGGTCEVESDDAATGAPAVQRAPARRGSSPAPSRPAQQRPVAIPLQRYYTEDCENFDANQRRRGVAIAIELATKAIGALSTYITAKSAGTPDPVTAKLLKDCFSSDSLWAAIRARAGFRKIKSYLEADDFTIECEDDCDDSNAYVYAVWTDVHMCMNVIKNYSERRFGEILLHEVSHVADGTDDEEYFYPPSGAKTTLSLSDALDNADCFEAFAAQV